MMRRKDKKQPNPSLACGPDSRFFQEVEIEFLVHELKDPLSVIETGIRTLMEKQDKYGVLGERQQRTLNRVLRNSVKTRQMVYDLLEVGRAQAACMTCCLFLPRQAVLAALMSALETFSEGTDVPGGETPNEGEVQRFLEMSGIFLDVSPQAEATELYHDEFKFRSIAGNLIKNALQYRRERMAVALESDGDTLVVSVSDDGPGIDPQHHEAVFQRYIRGVGAVADLPRSGHGLGLACSRILARSMGGDILLESRRGKGARFRLHLPISTIVERGDKS
ncbi:MAG: HAMP domain-containing histidine kinase [Desulfobacterales bacterium]|nr:HAMP domain-containing histidine kinase [Desulfobacterales bacterium]